MNTTRLSKRSILGSVLVVAVAAGPAEAGLIAYEGFDYAAGTVLSGGTANGGTGWNSGWKGAGSGATFTTAATGLTLTGLTPAPIGRTATQSHYDKPRAMRDLAAGPASGSVFYMSALIDHDYYWNAYVSLGQSTATAKTFAGFGTGGGGGEGGPWFPRAVAGNNSLDTGPASSTAGSSSTSTRPLVAKIGLANSMIYLFGDPTPGGIEPGTPTVSLSFSGGCDSSKPVDQLSMYAAGTYRGKIDEIRIADTWDEVFGMASARPGTRSAIR